MDEYAKFLYFALLLKIRGCALCGPLLSGDVISRVLRKLELS
jgi:hypothetical protein